METWFFDNEHKLILHIEDQLIPLSAGDYVDFGKDISKPIEIKRICYDAFANSLNIFVNITFTEEEVDNIIQECGRI